MPPKAAPGAKQAPPQKEDPKAAAKKEESMEDHTKKNDSMIHEDEVPTDNIRSYILKHYGINAEREKQRKEERVDLVDKGREFQIICSKHRTSGGVSVGNL